MTRGRARKLFRQHRGEAAKVSRQLGIAPASVSQWLRGRITSRRVANVVLARAAELEAQSEQA